HAQGFQVATSPAIALTTSTTHDFALVLARGTDSVTVTADGTIDQGYRVGAVTPLESIGSAPVLDTPYTVSVLPDELMVNGQTKNFKEASKFLPLVEFQEM